MARKPAAKGDTDRERARAVADRYFDFDRDDDEGGDEQRRKRHLDEGYEDGHGTHSRPGPSPASKPTRLTQKQAAFVREYLIDFNGTQAAIRAGYSAAAASEIAYENLRKPQVRILIEAEVKERSQRATWTADALLTRLGQELTADVADLFDDKGRLLPVNQWPLIFRQGLVAGIEVEETSQADATGEMIPGTIRKIKMSDRLKRLELLGKHININAFRERAEKKGDANPMGAMLDELRGTSIRPRDASASPVIEGVVLARPAPEAPAPAQEPQPPAPTPSPMEPPAPTRTAPKPFTLPLAGAGLKPRAS